MIHPKPSKALLAKSAVFILLGSVAHPQARANAQLAAILPSVILGSNQRNFSTAVAIKQAAVAESTPAEIPAESTAAAAADSALPLSAPSRGRISSRSRHGRPTADTDKAKLLIKWDWLCQRSRDELTLALESGKGSFPWWLNEQYELARSYRSARARLWVPTLEDLTPVIKAEEVKSVKQFITRKFDDDGEDLKQTEKALDKILRPVWENMTPSQREAALIKSRFKCIRKLGWRYGYSSGYPGSNHTELLKGFEKKGKEGLQALETLRKREEQEAWEAWQQLTSTQRQVEEKAAWRLRDRSQIYLDDSSDSIILGAAAPRWLPTPERAGNLTFLPNTIVRLVKNHTPEGQEYDAWKATFRVPLSMHKHALRSYLLAIYGLKTTWARSSVYRSPVTRDIRTAKVISGHGRTWKKVEVGLLEPFLFPEVSPDFKVESLMQSELDYERARVYMKITRTSRWRSKKPIAEYEQELRNAEAQTYSGNSVDEAVGRKKSVSRFMLRTKGLPSAKHGKILKLLAQQRDEKDRAVQDIMNKYKSEAEAAQQQAQQQA